MNCLTQKTHFHFHFHSLWKFSTEIETRDCPAPARVVVGYCVSENNSGATDS